MILQLPDVVRFNPVQLKARFVSFCFTLKTSGHHAEVDWICHFGSLFVFWVEKQKRDSKKPQVHKFELKIMNTREGKPNMPQAPILLIVFFVSRGKNTWWNPGSKIASKHPSTVEHLEKVGWTREPLLSNEWYPISPYPLGWIMIFMGWLYIYTYVHLLYHQNQHSCIYRTWILWACSFISKSLEILLIFSPANMLQGKHVLAIFSNFS